MSPRYNVPPMIQMLPTQPTVTFFHSIELSLGAGNVVGEEVVKGAVVGFYFFTLLGRRVHHLFVLLDSCSACC
jgi:hypothetical protein